MTALDVGSDPGPAAPPGAIWPQARWVEILDRVEHRQGHLGLRFSGPPLSLEVTMTGPDSDGWPAISEPPASWDWYSQEPCHEAIDLLQRGAGDDRVLEAVARYTLENLILNAVHEIGEWLRFDGQRVFPAHLAGQDAGGPGDEQGNGAVSLAFSYSPAPEPTAVAGTAEAADDLVGQDRRVPAGYDHFTYLPATAVEFGAAGPIVRHLNHCNGAAVWRAAWTERTIEAIEQGAPADEVIRAVVRDVHEAIVWAEADRICRALMVDGEPRWQLARPGAGPVDRAAAQGVRPDGDGAAPGGAATPGPDGDAAAPGPGPVGGAAAPVERLSLTVRYRSA